MPAPSRTRLAQSLKRTLPPFLVTIMRRLYIAGLTVHRTAKIFTRGLRGLGRPRYNIFSGTTTWSEIWVALRSLAGQTPLVDGPDIVEYEKCFAEATDTRYAFSFASGRMSLYAILEVLGIGPGDEIILPAFTCVVVPNAMIYRGVKPVYVDIEPGTCNIDVVKIEEKITPQTRAIYAQHTFGIVCDMDGISKIAEKHGLFVIEDCAHALGASLNGRMAGSLGHVAYFSTDHSKVISTSTGGIITCSDPELARKIAEVQRSTPFLSPKFIRSILWTFIIEYILFHPRLLSLGSVIHTELGTRGRLFYFYDELMTAKPSSYPYPARLSNAQAKIGISQIKGLGGNIARRRALALLYDKEIGAYKKALNGDFSSSTFLLYTFLVRDRDAWTEHLSPVLNMGIWFTSVCGGRECNLHEVGFEEGSCPVAEQVVKHCINLPTHLRLRDPHPLLELLRDARKQGQERLELLNPGTLPTLRQREVG